MGKFLMELGILLLLATLLVSPFLVAIGTPKFLHLGLLFFLGLFWSRICPILLPFLYDEQEKVDESNSN